MSANGHHNTVSVNGHTNGDSTTANNVVINGTVNGDDDGSSYYLPNVTEPEPVTQAVADSLRQALINGERSIKDGLGSTFDGAASDHIWAAWQNDSFASVVNRLGGCDDYLAFEEPFRCLRSDSLNDGALACLELTQDPEGQVVYFLTVCANGQIEMATSSPCGQFSPPAPGTPSPPANSPSTSFPYADQ